MSHLEYIYWKYQSMNSSSDEKDWDLMSDLLLQHIVIQCLKTYPHNSQDISIENLRQGIAFVNKCNDKGYDAIAFDMDFTANHKHSSGVLHRNNLNEYCNSASIDFLVAVVLLVMHNKQVAVLSFTDATYNGSQFNCPKETHIAGKDLIMEFLNTNFTKKIVDKIFCYGRNPDLHGEPKNKKNHIDLFMVDRQITDYKKVVLFDDSSDNINNTNVDAYLVDKKFAFRFGDLLT